MELASPDDRAERPGPGLESGDKSVTPNAQHTRTYQACIPCRRRKVRCDLGPVDNPHDPPCVRCRREAKECFFSATRRKKRAADSGAGADNVEADDYEVRGGRKRLKEGGDAPSDFGSYDAPSTASPVYVTQPLTPGGSLGRQQPLRRPDVPQSTQGDSENEDNEENVNDHTAAMLQTAELHHGHDALNVLLAAAQHRPDSRPDTRSSVPYHQYGHSMRSPGLAQHATSDSRKKPVNNSSTLASDLHTSPKRPTLETASALQAWSRFRFVRNGWFTAEQGMGYIDYFYSYLSPLTPIALPDYRSPSRHVTLLEDEPLLAVTMLMIASRYTPLKDNIGRSYALHQRLWAYTRGLIDRLFWGREMPGVYTSFLQRDAGCDVNPLSRKGLLTLGSVESLMLLTEWHSRYIHFPADEDDSELMAPEPSISPGGTSTDRHVPNQSVSFSIEPCFRSDRMCWKLLGMAMSVALEIGVFEKDSSRHSKAMPDRLTDIYEQRRLHVKSLLLVYITQTSGRLGVAAMLPDGYAVPALSELFTPSQETIKDIRDVVVHLWLQLACLVKLANEKLYANRHRTREIIRSGEYKTLLRQINPMLIEWRRQLNHYHDTVPRQMYHIMMIEYEHSRVCVNQLSLQAVIERCINNTGNEGEPGKAIPPDRLNQWYGDDREIVGTVIESCRNVLKIAVDGLAPGGFLKHAPVRTSFRLISVAIVLVKTFAFGANAKELAISLDILRRTVTALRENVVDDDHIANGFAQHIAFLVENTSKGLRRFPGPSQGNSGRGSARGSRAVSQSHAPQSLYASHGHPSDHGRMRDGSAADQQWAPNGVGGTNNVHTNGEEAFGLDGMEFNDNGDAFMLMPPPTNPQHLGMGHHPAISGASDYGPYGGGYGNSGSNSAFSFGQDGFADQDWMALPLDNIFGGQNVQQTGFGPAIDGDDMLDVLLGSGIH